MDDLTAYYHPAQSLLPALQRIPGVVFYTDAPSFLMDWDEMRVMNSVVEWRAGKLTIAQRAVAKTNRFRRTEDVGAFVRCNRHWIVIHQCYLQEWIEMPGVCCDPVIFLRYAKKPGAVLCKTEMDLLMKKTQHLLEKWSPLLESKPGAVTILLSPQETPFI